MCAEYGGLTDLLAIVHDGCLGLGACHAACTVSGLDFARQWPIQQFGDKPQHTAQDPQHFALVFPFPDQRRKRACSSNVSTLGKSVPRDLAVFGQSNRALFIESRQMMPTSSESLCNTMSQSHHADVLSGPTVVACEYSYTC